MGKPSPINERLAKAIKEDIEWGLRGKKRGRRGLNDNGLQPNLYSPK